MSRTRKFRVNCVTNQTTDRDHEAKVREATEVSTANDTSEEGRSTDEFNKFDQSTVNNMELSLGLFTRLGSKQVTPLGVGPLMEGVINPRPPLLTIGHRRNTKPQMVSRRTCRQCLDG